MAQLPIQLDAGSKLLYPHASGLERALADVSTRRMMGLYAEIIADQWDAYEISENNLPYLAWAKGVNLWEDIWSLSAKRHWVAKQWEFQAKRGTLGAIKMALAQSGYDITSAVTPPQGIYVNPDLTPEEYNNWIRLMPELRIYYAARTGRRGINEIFVDDADENGNYANVGFVDEDFIGLDDGWALRGRLAVLRQRGVDTPLQVIQYERKFEDASAVDYERVSTIGKADFDHYVDDTFLEDERFIGADTDPKLYTLRLDRTYSRDATRLSLSTVTPNLEPLSPRYEIDSLIGNAGPWVFVDDVFVDDDKFADAQDGGDKMLAQRVYLLDRSVTIPLTEGDSYVDVSRIGLQKYTAELQIDLHTKEVGPAIFVGEHFVDDDLTSFIVPEDDSHRERAIRAVLAAKALRDSVLVTFDPKRPLQMGDPLTSASTVEDWVAEPL